MILVGAGMFRHGYSHTFDLNSQMNRYILNTNTYDKASSKTEAFWGLKSVRGVVSYVRLHLGS